MSWQINEDLVIFDTETTSVVIPESHIVEIAAIRVDKTGAKIGIPFHTYVNPGVPIPKLSSDVHGIYDKDVAVSPVTRQALDMFFNWCDGNVVTSYNLPYDRGVINVEIERVDVTPLKKPSWRFDSRVLAQRLIHPSKIENYRQSTVAKYFNISADAAHHADGDVEMLYQILRHLFDEFIFQYPGVEFKYWITTDMILDVWRGGKHKCRRFEDTPLDYLLWASGTMVGDELFTIRHILRTKYNLK